MNEDAIAKEIRRIGQDLHAALKVAKEEGYTVNVSYYDMADVPKLDISVIDPEGRPV